MMITIEDELIMELYTSYFAKLNKIPKHIVPVSICGKAPEWYKGLQYKKLAPKWGFFKQWKENHDNDFYIRHFNSEVLDYLDQYLVIQDLEWLTEADAVCLLCYEKPEDFCHRHLVAQWFKDRGIKCEELKL